MGLLLVFCGLTFEVRRDQRRAARPGRKDDMPNLEAGPSGPPLVLASAEGLELSATEIPDQESSLAT